MKRFSTLLMCISLVLVLGHSTGYAQTKHNGQKNNGQKANEEKYLEEHLGEMSLEELLGVKTKTATKVEQTVQEAPATIEVITREELQQMGVENLYQALSFLPGINITESFNGYTDVVIRGVVPSHFNNKVLLMIDGHPVEDPFTGSFYLKGFPLKSVERVEVIRGPASVLYGTNAFSGVINIVTRKNVKKGEASLTARYGMYNVKQAGIYAGGNLGKDGYFVFAGNGRYGDNYDLKVDADIEGDNGKFPYTDNFGNLFFKAVYKDFEFHAFGYLLQKQKFGYNAAISARGDAEQAGLGAMLRYDKKITKKVETAATYWFDLHKRTELLPYPFLRYVQGTSKLNPVQQNPLYARYMAYKHGLDWYVNWKAVKGLNLMAGLTFEYWHYRDLNAHNARDAFHLSSKDSYSIDVIQPYAQVIYSIGDFSFSAGVRADRNKVIGWSVVPRAGIVWQAAHNMYLKALYGQAYRAPSIYELTALIPDVLVGNQKLKSERVQTAELTFDYKIKGHHEITADTYFLYTKNEIRQVARAVEQNGKLIAPKTYDNMPGITVVGGSVEGKGDIYNKHGLALRYQLNISAKWAKDRYKDRRIDYMAPVLLNAGIRGNYKGFYFYPWVQYVPPRTGKYITNIKGPSVYSSSSEKIPGYVLVNLRLGYRVTKWLELSVVGYNLANQRIDYPDMIVNFSQNLLNSYFDGSKRSVIIIPGQPITAFGEITIRL